ncbi:MAG: glycosyltransferase [Akkermansia sp.]|nr:glycosyltransferase [Akkermansia sp.]
MPENPLVVIRSLVYNHEPYLRQCLDGFVMQQTTFPFVAVVHDDCSTDGSAAILREYAEKYPDIIKPIYEDENQYSKRDGSLNRIMSEACGKYGAKYIALCEGDDCWTDPHKLQKQVDFLEAHPEYTMACSNAVVMTPRGEMSSDDLQRRGWPTYAGDCDIPVEDTITKGGWLIHTASIVYRCGLKDDYPEACVRRLIGGDTQLQIFAALKGKIRYFHKKMVVYRLNSSPVSWTASVTQKRDSRAIQVWESDVAMYESLDAYSGGRYEKEFHLGAMKEIGWQMNLNRHLLPEAMPRVGYVFMYSYLAPYYQERLGKGVWAYLKHRFLKWCYYPYYPQPEFDFLLRPLLRPFFKSTGAKWSYCIAGHPVLTVVECLGKKRVFLCGVRVR